MLSISLLSSWIFVHIILIKQSCLLNHNFKSKKDRIFLEEKQVFSFLFKVTKCKVYHFLKKKQKQKQIC